jgi:hypothetical protein
MGLERRGNGMYYYRKERRGKHVVSVYAGRGGFGVMVAALDKERREERERKRHAEHQARFQVEEQDRQLKEIGITLSALVRANLIANGCHTHKGQWRYEQKSRQAPKPK